MEDLTALVDWSRAQFALTAMYHWLFVPLTLGLSVIIGIMETIYYRTRDVKWLATTKFWMTLFGINFAVGVATGIILEFEFGTNWSNYSWFVGDIFGAPLAIEGILAFFMESTFIAVMFFGWNKVSPKFHLASTWLTALGASISALWILIANAWMQHPVGMEFEPEQMRNVMTDFWALVFSPVAVNKFIHTVLSGWCLAGVFVVGVSAWLLLKKRNVPMALRSIKVGAWVGLVGIVLTAGSGDGSAKVVSRVQPMKLAAMEGLYHGHQGQSIVAMGILNPDKTHDNAEEEFIFDISIPYGLSILANGDMNSFVPGVADLVNGISIDANGDTINTVSYAERIARGKMAQEALRKFDAARAAGDNAAMDAARAGIKENFNYFGYGYLNSVDEAIPNVPLVFYSFHIMVILGGYFMLFFVLVLFLVYKRDNVLTGNRWIQLIAIASIPLVWICSEAGWVVAEVGRQPWTIEGLLPNCAAVSAIPTTSVMVTFFIFVVVFAALLAAEIKIMLGQISRKSLNDLDKAEL
ncbi:MAG: cytochrome ubiquinol oxidase subunit I [Bacteroidales bacterium]|nr:cytochrome ubiquinol oxidase subunit I [Bacteroidales bacterium]